MNNRMALCALMCVAQALLADATASTINFPGGRIAYSADGNQHDHDDIGATAAAIAMVSSAGLGDRLVHCDFSNHLGNNNKEMDNDNIESTLGGAKRFGLDASKFFNDQTQLEEAINNFKKEGDKSSEDDPLWYICAGPMEVPWRCVNAVDPEKRQYIHVISHAGWNDKHADTPEMTHRWQDIAELGATMHKIRNQNNSNGDNDFSGPLSEWQWLKNSDDENWKWLYSRNQFKDKFDISDSGMMYWLITGGPNRGNQKGGPNELKDLLSNPVQAAESAAASANQERMPAFSWDNVPLYVHIRKDTAFTDEEIQYLATFPLITFEKATGHRDFGSVDAGTLKAARAVKAVNPDTKILYYRNVIVHYGGYSANASLRDVPGAFLVDRNGNDKLIRNRIQAYDLSNKALRDWWIDAVEDVCSDPSVDGVFLDGVVKIIEPAFLRGVIGQEKKAAELAGYETMMADTRKMLGPQKLMLANILRARFSDSGLSYIRALDGSYIEGFEGAVGMSRKDYVAQGIRDFQTAAREGSIVAYTGKLGRNLQDADETPRSAGRNNNRARPSRDAQSLFDYQLAIFLTCAEKYSYFYLKDGYDAKRSNTWLTRRADYDRPLGPPKGPALRDGYTYTREFAHASVQLDIENETASIVWKPQE